MPRHVGIASVYVRVGSVVVGALAALLFTPNPSLAAQTASLDPLAIAASHPIVYNEPGPTFFTGALLGNGGLGAVVCTRPDAIMIHFGHNDVWDQRIALDGIDKLGTFEEVFAKMCAIPEDLDHVNDDPWYESYRVMTRENYRKPFPRPMPCGTLVLGFDPRRVEMLGRKIDISTGLCRIDLLVDGKPVTAEVFVEMGPDRLWIRVLDSDGNLMPSVFDRIHLFEDPKTPEELPKRTALTELPAGALGFRQILPYGAPPNAEPHANDRAFAIAVRTSSDLGDSTWLTAEAERRNQHEFERRITGAAPFVAVVQLEHSANDTLPHTVSLPQPTAASFDEAFDETTSAWAGYWARSAVRLSGPTGSEAAFLEQIWYWNLYFFNCAARRESAWPGLYANWSYGDIGTMWHGDYHLDYNVQQPTWLTFSSNHVDKHLAYVDTLNAYWLPTAHDWAQRFYGMRGAFFPVTLYPIEMQINPYPVPPWGYMICCTPWAVQSLWWHYEYTLDKEYLRDRAFVPIRDAVLFLVDYMTRPDAHGEAWGDDNYHVFPSAVPELYGFVPGFTHNADPLPDLALIKFVFNAYLQATEALDLESEEGDTIDNVKDILAHFPDYATADSEYGEIYVNIANEDPDTVQNVPASMMHVFPGEDFGIGAPGDIREKLLNTWRNLRTEGGNDLVFRNMIGARLGQLDLSAFAREVRYTMMDNSALSDPVRQVHGRYTDITDFFFMNEMGIWAENFAAPAVLNESLLQSWNGEIHLFPNWPRNWDATFTTLRAKGAFLVSAEYRDGTVQWIEILSEKGAPLRLKNPWPNGARVHTHATERFVEGGWIELDTKPNQRILLSSFEDGS